MSAAYTANQLNNVKVVGFLPPFAPDVLNEIIASNNFNYMDSIYNKLNISFNKYNHELWDFTDPKKINSDDTEFIDGFHGGDLTYLKIIKYMADNNSLIKDYININNINLYYSKYKNKFEIK